MKKLFGTFLFTLIVLIIGGILVVYANGTRLDRKGNLTSSGILQIDTTPNAANVFVDDQHKGESDISIENLQPGIHKIRIEKDRYQTWEKEIEVKKGLVTPIFLNLFPTNPALTPITFTGVLAPKLSYDRRTLVYGASSGNNKGLWSLNLTNERQFFFGSSSTPKQIVADTNLLKFSAAETFWSPNDEQILAVIILEGGKTTRSFLLNAGEFNNNPEEITTNQSTNLQNQWQIELKERQDEVLEKMGNDAVALAKNAKSISFSTDETAVLIVNEEGSAQVFDSKPSPVPGTKPATYKLPKATSYAWLAGTNKNLLLINKNQISVSDIDGKNRVGIFSGSFTENVVYSYPDGSKLVIAINLNPEFNSAPNLYTISLN